MYYEITHEHDIMCVHVYICVCGAFTHDPLVHHQETKSLREWCTTPTSKAQMELPLPAEITHLFFSLEYEDTNKTDASGVELPSYQQLHSQCMRKVLYCFILCDIEKYVVEC